MRIRAIRGRGLASLAAPFELDLDAAPMRGAGVFVIGGPTGAGKSTILDAMCLALFDRAPRLARSPQRDVVRAGTRSALGSDRASEVEGEGDAARGSTPVGAGKGRVASAAEPDVIRTNDPRAIVRRGARHAFAEVDFEARGGGLFRARWEVRAVRRRDGGWSLGKPTMSLVVLGARAARDGDAARAGATPRGPLLADAGLRVGTTKTDVLAQIEARLGLDYGQFCRSVLLPQGELASFLEAPDDERARLLERVTGTEIYSTLSRVVHTRAATLVREARERSLEIDALPLLSEPERDELVVQRDEAAIEAARAQKRVAELVASERAHETLRVLASELGQAERELDDVSRQLGLWEPRRGEVTLALRAREVRAERELARGAAVERGRAEAELSSVSARLEESEPALTRAATEVREAEGELRALEARGEPLEAELAAHEQALAAWSERSGRDEALRQARRAAELAADASIQRERAGRKSLEAFERELARVEAELGAAGTETSIEPLAALLRHEVAEGEPCPVCGALEHPALGQRDGSPTGRARSDARSVVQAIELRRDLATRREALRLEASRAQVAAALRREEVERARAAAEEARLAAEQCAADRAVSRRAIEAEHGVEPPAMRRAAHARALSGARARLSLLERDLGERQALAAHLRGTLETVTARLTKLRADEVRAAQGLERALALHGLGLDELREAERLDDRDLARWAAELDRLDQRRGRQRAIVEERRRRLEDEAAAVPPELPAREELEAARRDAERTRAQAEQIRAVAEARLADDAARREERARRTEALGALRTEAQTWETLARLVGSADGKKLRLVVQSMALDLLLAHANEQLRALAPRYRLVRRTTQPGSLALDVIDGDLEGGARATSSLSGGERFLVSLALALGLGTMTAERDDVGSLFLDEGFGSLDEESLEQALEALDALRQAGRQIGVVSHVARLAERFEVRVEVRPVEPGASTVHVTTA